MVTSRKSDHLQISLNEDVESGVKTGLDRFTFTHEALPEIDFTEIDCSQTLFKRYIRYPLLISSMTGGTEEAEKINRVLAEAANSECIGMGVGSQRAAIDEPELRRTYQVRRYAPNILLLANIGAVQLNYRYSVDECKQAVDMIEADGLILHLNALQEAVQPEGNTNFSGLLKKIELVCKSIQVPVIVKEVGNGISSDAGKRLLDVGVAGIDVAGAGGTSWSQVEMYRNSDPHRARVAGAFRNWGIPTAESVINVRTVDPSVKIIASGGIKNGVDIAKCIALGACMGGIARLFLQAANQSLGETIETIREITREIQICMFLVSAQNLEQLRNTPLEYHRE